MDMTKGESTRMSSRQIYKTDKIRMEAEIGEMDPSGNRSYDAGRLFLLQWYRDQFP